MKFNPHDYQKYAIRFIEDHAEAMMMLDMGLGRKNCNRSFQHP